MKSKNPGPKSGSEGQYGEIVDALRIASRAAAAKEIDLFRPGRQREVIVAHRLGHTLRRDPKNNLVDAFDDEGNRYSYLSAHFGKRAQILIPCRTPDEAKTAKTKCMALKAFIISHFSSHDACQLLTLWRCSPQAIWSKVQEQIGAAESGRPVYFTEAFLKDGGAGCGLLFRADDRI